MSNQWEEAARARKIENLIRYLDRLFTECGYDLVKDAAECAAWLLQQDAAGWKQLAKQAGVNAPSNESVSAIVQRYEERARAPQHSDGRHVQRHAGVN